MKRLKLLLLLLVCIPFFSFYRHHIRKRLNDEQILVLRKAAQDLNFKIQNFKSSSLKIINSPSKQEAYTALRDSLFVSSKEVKKIQNAFLAVSTNGNLCSSARNYFNDILYRYDEGQDSLINDYNKPDNISKSYTAVLYVFEYNYRAYSVIAEEKELQFDLTINSIPQGAAIYYWKDGDAMPEKFHKPTLATIENLDYCKWHFGIHMDGYLDQQKDFDPYNEKEKVLDFGLLKPVK